MAPRTLEEILAAVEEITGQLAQSAARTGDPLAAVAAAFESRAWADKHLADRIAEARYRLQPDRGQGVQLVLPVDQPAGVQVQHVKHPQA